MSRSESTMKRIQVLVLGGMALSCGGSGGGSDGGAGRSPAAPVAPSPPPSGWSVGTVLTVVSGETDAPVADAAVTVAGTPYTTDGEGQAFVATPVAEGATVDIGHPDFLTRQTLVRHSATRLTLWPDNASLPNEYTRKLVYTASTVGDSESLVPLDRLPPRVQTLAIVPTGQLANDLPSLAAHRQAADYFNVAVEGRTVFAVGGPADMTVATRIDPEEESCLGHPTRLFARVWYTRHEVTRAEIVFCSRRPSLLPSPIAHELGHVFGLAHSADHRDLMWPSYHPRDERSFSPREILTMQLMYLRRGGNTWPDNDREAATSGSWTRVFLD